MKRKNRVPVLLNDEELARLDEIAKKEEVSRSEAIRKLIDRYKL